MTEGPVSRTLCEKEVEREALRLFPKLIRDNGYFMTLGLSAASEERRSAGLFTRRNGYRRAVVMVAVDLVRAFHARGWLESDGGRQILADAGSAWFRRQMSGADPFRGQHQLRGMSTREVEAGVRRPVLVNDGESPLGWLRRRKDRDGRPMISAEQFEAGDRLRSDFTRAQLTPSVTARWGAMASSRRSRRAAPDGPAGISDAAVAAKKRVYNAIDAVGPELAGVLVDVCCQLRGLEDLEKQYGWPRRSGKAILRIALSALARHYGLGVEQDRSNSKPRRLRHWGSDDFKPTLNKWR